MCFTLRAAMMLDPQMVYRNPTRSIQASARKRLRAGIYESSIVPRNQSTVGWLLVGPGSTGDTLRLCTAGRAHVHMEDCRRSDPLVVATFCTRWPLISVRVSACCCLTYWSAQQRLTLFCVQISCSLKGHKASHHLMFGGVRAVVYSKQGIFWMSKVSCCWAKFSRVWAGGKARREWCAHCPPHACMR